MADVTTALQLMQSMVPAPVAETVLPLEAEGRVLAALVAAREPVPAWARAAMDGFAVLTADLAGARPGQPVELAVVGTAAPGRPYACEVKSGQAVAIATGAPLPAGADAIVRWEEVQQPEPGRVRFLYAASAGYHISFPGEDLPVGALALAAGTVMGALELGVLVMLGEQQIKVWRRPRVTILCTGDELVEPHRTPGFGQIRNVNGPVLAAMVRQAGGVPVYLGTAADHPEAIACRLAAAPESDLILTTGGVSQGAPDRVAEAAAHLQAPILFNRLDQKPGAACLGAVLRGRPWIGLSGNPAAAFTQFDFLVRPLMARAAGRTDTLMQPVFARLAEGIRKSCPERRYLRARVAWQGQHLVVDASLAQQSTVLSSLIQAHGYIELAPDACPAAGEVVRVWLKPHALPVPDWVAAELAGASE